MSTASESVHSPPSTARVLSTSTTPIGGIGNEKLIVIGGRAGRAIDHSGMSLPRRMTDVDHVDGSVAPTTKDHVVMPSANVTSTTRVHVMLIEPSAGVTDIGAGGIKSSNALTRIHRMTALGTAHEEARGCSCESGIMVLEQKPARKQGAPNRCCHRTNPTVSASSLTTIAWWPMPACSCRPL